MLPGQVAKQPYFTFISKLRNKSSLLTFGLGLFTGFIIRDEIAFPTMQTIDNIIVEYERSEVLLLTEREQVLKRIAELEKTQKQGTNKSGGRGPSAKKDT